jgi:hypothetical protein
MLELPMTPFRYHQVPTVSLEHPNHLTYLHDSTISEEKNQVPDHFAERLFSQNLHASPDLALSWGEVKRSVKGQRTTKKNGDRQDRKPLMQTFDLYPLGTGTCEAALLVSSGSHCPLSAWPQGRPLTCRVLSLIPEQASCGKFHDNSEMDKTGWTKTNFPIK